MYSMVIMITNFFIGLWAQCQASKNLASKHYPHLKMFLSEKLIFFFLSFCSLQSILLRELSNNSSLSGFRSSSFWRLESWPSLSWPSPSTGMCFFISRPLLREPHHRLIWRVLWTLCCDISNSPASLLLSVTPNKPPLQVQFFWLPFLQPVFSSLHWLESR